MKHLHEHNDNEERDDLPLLEPKLGEDGSSNAAKDFKKTKQFAPTRSALANLDLILADHVVRAHPWAPNRPPYETVAAFLALPMDKLKDAFSKFPDDDTKARTEARSSDAH
jgi:hypothetical protein